MVAINRGDNTRAFGSDFLRIYLNNPNHLYISKAVFHVNGELEKVYEHPVFPLHVNFTGEETKKLRQDNTCKLALWDESGRRRTADGKFTFFVRENRIKEPDNPDYYGDEYYEEEDNVVYFNLEDPEFAAEFTINATPSKMSELEQDIPLMTPEQIVGGRNIHTYIQDNNVIIEAEMDAVQSYNSLIDKPSVNGIELKGNVEIECTQVQADYKETDPESKAYIKNKPNLANVAYSGNYNDLVGVPNIPSKVSDLDNDLHFIDKNTDKLVNYYNKEEVDEKIQTEFDPTPIYDAIDVVQTNLNTVEHNTQVEIGQLETQIEQTDTQLKNQINSVRDNLNIKINNVDTKVDGVINVVNEKVDVDTFVNELGLKANTQDVAQELAGKVDLDTYTTAINKKADKSSIGNGLLTITSNDVIRGQVYANSTYNTNVEIPVPEKVSELTNDLGFVTREEISTDGFATKEELEQATSTKVEANELGHGILTIQINGNNQGTFSANAQGNKTVNLNVPTKLSELEKDIDILTEDDLTIINNEIHAVETAVGNNASNISDLYNELGNKVDKESGKSLISNTEIERLANVVNYDDTEITNNINTLNTNVQTLSNSLENKVDKVDGKTLSTNDFTNGYKDKVDGNTEHVTELLADVNTLKTTSNEHTNAIAGLQESTTVITSNLNAEITNRINGINDLQAQIDGMEAKSAVAAIVETYEDLNNVDISKLVEGDTICVLSDETHEDATTYYLYTHNSFQYIGSEGSKYTRAQSDERFVQKSIMINGHPLENNVELIPSDIGALPDTTVIGNGRLTVQVEAKSTKDLDGVTQLDVFDANQTNNTAVKIPVPSKFSHLNNDMNLINQDALDGAVETIGDHFTVVETNINTLTDKVGTIEGVISGDVSGLSKVSFTNDYRDLDHKPTIPTALSQMTNDMGFISSSKDPSTTSLEEILSEYQLKADVATKVSQLENDRGYVTNSAIGRGILTVKINGQDFTDNTWMANEKDPRTINIPVDSELSTTSVLPIQNNIITNKINAVDSSCVHIAGNETITGDKTFNGIVNLTTANSTTVDRGDNSNKVATTAFVKNQDYCTNTDAVHKDLDETITGNKTFSGVVNMSEATADTVITSDNSNNVATTAFVKNQDYAVNANTVHTSGNEIVQGNKTFNDTITHHGIVQLGDYAHVTTPNETSTGYAIDLVTNVEYVQDKLSEVSVDLQNRITNVQTTLQTNLDNVQSDLQGEIGAIEQALEEMDVQTRTFTEITEPATVVELDSLNYLTVTQNTSITTPNVTDDYYHEIRIQMYVPSTDYTINLGTSITIDEVGYYDIKYIWFKPLERWICNITKY